MDNLDTNLEIAAEDVADETVQALSELQLALVGGGCGEVVFH